MCADATTRPADAVPVRSSRLRPPASVTTSLIALGSCALAVCTMGVGARDDDYITYWAAEQLALHGHLVNLNGARLEQSSSFAHVVVLALLYAITRAPLPLLGYLVGIASLGLTVYGGARLARRIDPRAEVPAAVAVGVAYPIVFWATGGLETLLAAASVCWFVSSLHLILTTDAPSVRRRLSAAGAAALVVSVRPDTMLVALVVVAGVVVAHLARPRLGAFGERWLPALRPRGVLLGATVVVGAAAALAAFRLVVFGHPLPQPELSKAGGLGWLGTGFSYVATSLPWWLWLAFLALGAVALATYLVDRSAAGLLALGTFATGCVCLMFTRGDWMGGARLLVPYLAPGIAAMVAALATRPAWARRGAVAALLAAELVALVLFVDGAPWISSSYTAQTANPRYVIAADVGSSFGATVTSSAGPVPSLPWYTSWDFVHERDGIFLSAATPTVRRLLASHRGARVTIASYQAGMVMYTWDNEFPGRLRFIDLDGLVTDTFSRCPHLRETFAGDIMSLSRWERDAGGCAPPLPDLVFFLVPPSDVPGLSRYYKVASLVIVTYRRHALFASPKLVNVEFLAVRRGFGTSTAPALPSAGRRR